MKLHRQFVLLALITALTVPGLAGAAEEGKSPGHHGAPDQKAAAHQDKKHSGGGHNFSGHWAASLDEAQKLKVDVMHLELDRDLVVLKAQEELVQKEINALTARDGADTAAINAKIDELMAVKTKIMRARYAHILEMRAILTTAQRVSYDMDVLARSGAK
ncbi:MAG: hypothetical protein FD165_1635 [Gammaproteobacteria bacterium]|nr:MAG: hypothetical protein FD165_1635 [Gammaproteobacteria bacterium]TND02717.1 MAG: hypothetical protein FD120_2178 [Gammaproteobacteria bacterium]